MKTSYSVLCSKGRVIKSGVATVLLASAAGAHAALPDWATDIGDKVTTAVTDTAALVGPVIGAALVAAVIITLVKRFVKKI